MSYSSEEYNQAGVWEPYDVEEDVVPTNTATMLQWRWLQHHAVFFIWISVGR